MQETAISAQIRFLPALLLLSLFIGCSDLSDYDTRQIQSTLNDTLTTTTESWDVRMRLMKDERTRIMIEGSYSISYHSQDRKETRIDGPVYVQLYDSLNRVETEAWSKRAVYLEKDRKFELYDSVRVLTRENSRLFTEYLIWSQDTDRIESPSFVTIITAADSISGLGFEGSTDLVDYEIEQPRGRMVID